MVEERYEIRGKIGQGGVGAVYKAYDTQLRREVAIKRVLADELDKDIDNATSNLLKEATALSSVQHPHICTVYDSGLDEEGPFVVMELINGKTLDEMVERGTLTYDDFREVAIQSQEAMIAAQELNLVHRDLKPSNVMVSWLPSGRFQIKLVDFGLAKFSAKPSLQTIDHGDSVFGSIFFMAPEQFERTALDLRTDMYSLGAMFYYSLTGNYPFDGDTAPQVMASHLQNTVIPLQQVRPDLPVWLCEWVMWHIQRDMEHRPSSAKLALEKFLADEATSNQGGMTHTQQIITPAPPLLQRNNTGLVSAQSRTLNVQAPTANTAPQPILSPDGKPSTNTSPVAIRAAGAQLAANPATSTTTAYIAPTHAQTAPVQTAQTAVHAVPEMMQPVKKPMNKTLVIVICSMLEGETLPVTRKELDNILTSMAMPEIKDKVGGSYALSLAVATNDDFIPAIEIAKFATTPSQGIGDNTMDNIFKAVALNPTCNKEAHKILLGYAAKNPDKPQSEQAIKRMTTIADDSFVDEILTVYENTNSISVRNNCANTLAEIIKGSRTKSSIAADIINRYENADTEVKKVAYLRLLGTTGSKEALNLLYKQLKNSDIKYRLAAAKGLSKTPSIEPFEPILKVYAAEQNSANGKRLQTNLLDLLEANSDIKDIKKVELWEKFIKQSPVKRNAQRLIDQLASKKTSWSKKTLTQILNSSEYDTETKEFVRSRQRRWANE